MTPIANVDIEPEHLKTVTDLLGRYLPDREVWAYGSRVSGRARKYSDLNLAVMGEGFPDDVAMFHLREDLSESLVPFMIDLKAWAGINPAYHQDILDCYAVIHSPPESASAEAAFVDEVRALRGIG